jgi:hypothetical protein
MLALTCGDFKARPAGFKIQCCVRRFRAYVGGMDWQQVSALVIVATTAGLFVWSRFRRRKFDFKRDTHCGCGEGGNGGTQGSIVFHARKGEKPQIIVKMK